MKSHSVKNGGLRIDLYLFDLVPDLTRSKIQSLIKSGKVLVDSKPTKPSYILKGNEEISYNFKNKWLNDKNINKKIVNAQKRAKNTGICKNVGPKHPNGLTPFSLYNFIVSDEIRDLSFLYFSCKAFNLGCNAPIALNCLLCLTLKGVKAPLTIKVNTIIANPKFSLQRI